MLLTLQENYFLLLLGKIHYLPPISVVFEIEDDVDREGKKTPLSFDRKNDTYQLTHYILEETCFILV